MKKSYLTLAAVAAIMASCSNEVLIDGPVENDVEIGFSTFTDKVTKAENSTADYSEKLYDHHDNFAVWGYKNTEADKVFDNQLVSGTTNNVWTYSPARFWDKAAKDYYFYAAAPRTSEAPAWEFCGGDDVADNSHYFKLNEAAVYGKNLSVQNNTDGYIESFKSVTDVDYMIAAPCHVERVKFGEDVQLNFIHILSRLNVTVQTTLAAPAVVTLKSLDIIGLKNCGNFNEGAENPNETHPGSNARWSSQYGTVTYSALTNYIVKNVTSKDKYVIQSLVIPQDADVTENLDLDGSNLGTTPSPYIKIVYTIDPDGANGVDAETFTAYYNLAYVFGRRGTETLAFNEGWQNTLNMTISPVEIKFVANSAVWATNYNNDLTVY